MLKGLRILVTQADVFMGPALCKALAAQGATVLADVRDLQPVDAPAQMLTEHGPVDVLVANLAMPAPVTLASEVSEDEWQAVFNSMVHPLQRMVKAVLPSMQAQGHGKVVVMGSASALRGMKRSSSYSAARGAQLAYVQAVGVEMAPFNIQVNAINPGLTESDSIRGNPQFEQARGPTIASRAIRREMTPADLVGTLLYLCSSASDFVTGQALNVDGGKVNV